MHDICNEKSIRHHKGCLTRSNKQLRDQIESGTWSIKQCAYFMWSSCVIEAGEKILNIKSMLYMQAILFLYFPKGVYNVLAVFCCRDIYTSLHIYIGPRVPITKYLFNFSGLGLHHHYIKWKYSFNKYKCKSGFFLYLNPENKSWQ